MARRWLHVLGVFLLGCALFPSFSFRMEDLATPEETAAGDTGRKTQTTNSIRLGIPSSPLVDYFSIQHEVRTLAGPTQPAVPRESAPTAKVTKSNHFSINYLSWSTLSFILGVTTVFIARRLPVAAPRPMETPIEN